MLTRLAWSGPRAVQGAALASVVRKLSVLFALRAVESDLPWFIAEGLLPPQASAQKNPQFLFNAHTRMHACMGRYQAST